jgi:hypothetical protein
MKEDLVKLFNFFSLLLHFSLLFKSNFCLKRIYISYNKKKYREKQFKHMRIYVFICMKLRIVKSVLLTQKMKFFFYFFQINIEKM